SVVKKPLLDAGVYDATQLGLIGACLLGAYSVGKLGNGVLADRVNVAVFIALGLGLSSFMNLWMGMTTTLAIACGVGMVNGYAQGVGATASIVSLRHWFGARELGLVYGLWSASHSIGEGITFNVTPRLVRATDWRAAFIAPGAWCLVIAVVAGLVLRD